MTTADDRIALAHCAADALEQHTAPARACVGFDGFVDSIIDVVDARSKPGPTGYDRIGTIEHLAARIGGASGKSGNFELAVTREKIGGNGVLLADAMLRLGAEVVYIGSIADPALPDDPSSVHPVFHDFAQRCEAVRSVGPPGLTDALEFDDGKLMFGKYQHLHTVTYDAILRALGGEGTAVAGLAQRPMLAMGNWTMLSGMASVWDALNKQLLPALAAQGVRVRIFVDLADPAKRSDAEVLHAMTQLRAMQSHADVLLGTNAAEAARISELLGLPAEPNTVSTKTAKRLREAIGISNLLVHNSRSAAGATARKKALFEGPYTRKPTLLTGAGDHFNGGYCVGWAMALPLAERLAIGCATSGWYVRHGQGPSREELIGFLRDLPLPETASEAVSS